MGPVLRSCNASTVFDLRVTLSGLVFERVSGLLCECAYLTSKRNCLKTPSGLSPVFWI